MGSRSRSAKRRSQSKPERTSPRGPLIPAHHERYVHIAVLVVGFLVVGIAALVLGQDNNWDLRNYHYYNPHAFLNDLVGHDIAPAQRQSYLNPVPDLPYYFGTRLLTAKTYSFLLGGVQGITLWLLFAISFSCLRSLAPNARLVLSLLCAGLGVYAPVFVGEIGTTLNDSLLGMFVLSAMLLLARAYEHSDSTATPDTRRSLLVASFVFGAAVGFKLTLLLYALGAGVGLMVAERSWRDRGIVAANWTAAFLVGFLVANGWWMFKIWQIYDNPLFPFYNDIFKSSWAQHKSFADESMLPESLWVALSRPFAFYRDTHFTQAQHNFRDVRFAVVYVLLAATGVTWLLRRFRGGVGAKSELDFPPAYRFILVFFVVSFVVWEAQFSILRYTSGLEAVAPLVIVIIAGTLIPKSQARSVIVAFSFVPIVVMMRPIEHPRIEFGSSFWDVQVPRIEDPANTLIFQANPRPWSYIRVKWPNEVRYINVKSNLMYPDHDTRLNDEIKSIIASHDGDMFLLSRSKPHQWLEHDGPEMEGYGLRVVTEDEKLIRSRHSLPDLVLWRLEKIKDPTE